MPDPSTPSPDSTATHGDDAYAALHRVHAAATRRFAGWLADDDIDAAIDHGLMDWTPCLECVHIDARLAEDCVGIAAAQSQLRVAWAARERYRARQVRLERRAAERASARAATAAPGMTTSSLPSAAAAVLARAKARAARAQ